MSALRRLSIVLAVVVPLIHGCPGTGESDGFAATDLTAAERAAISSAIEASGALSRGVGVAQLPPGNIPSGQSVPGSATVGTCPAITTSINPDDEEDVAIDVTIDFGATPCLPDAFPGLSCSGSASGSFNPVSRSIELIFNDIRCGADRLTGRVSAAYEFSATGVNFNGSFDLDWSSGEDRVTADGQGQYGHDRAARASVISRFDGLVSNLNGNYAVAFSDVVVSHPNNATLIPSAGVITVSGPDTRSITVRFDQNSPSTGNVEASINSSAFFPVNLFAL